MSTNLLVVLILMVTYAHALNNLAQIQQPVPGIQLPNILGRWFTTFRKPPCSWGSSNEFADISDVYSFDGKNSISLTMSWKAFFCNTVMGKMIMTPTPGVFLLKDGFGDFMSSKMVVIGTDYNEFLIYWGCTKISVLGDKCDDPYISVETRASQPSLKTISKINSVLMERFGFNIDALDRVLHSGACYAGANMPQLF